MNNNKVDSIGTGCIVIAHLFPRSDQENCICTKATKSISYSFLFIFPTFLFIFPTLLCVQSNQLWKKTFNPAGNCMFKVNNRNTRTRCEICSKLTIKTPERRLASFWCLYC